MAEVTVKVARTLDDLMHVFAVRSVVYMGDQNCPFEEEYDGNDFTGASHLIAYVDGNPAGAMRLRWFSDFVKFERASVLKPLRRERVIHALLAFAFKYAGERGYRKIIAHAQSQIARFWKRFGFVERCGRQKFCFSDYDYVEMEAVIEAPKNAIHINSDPMKLNRPDGIWDEVGVLERSAYRNVMPGDNDAKSTTRVA